MIAGWVASCYLPRSASHRCTYLYVHTLMYIHVCIYNVAQSERASPMLKWFEILNGLLVFMH